MLTSGQEIGDQLEQMNTQFFASFDSLTSRRKKSKDDRSSTGSSTARAPSSGPSTIGRRTLDPLNLMPRDALLDTASRGDSNPGFDIPLPQAYARSRHGSTGSAVSNTSLASGEVFGRMDPEIDDERRRGSRFGQEWSG
jgi:autophagy-related protein 13